jgi:hypothetical protein
MLVPLLALAVVLIAAPIAAAAARSTTPKADPVVFTLTGKDGNARPFTMAELQALPAYTGYAGFKDSANTLNDYGLHPVKGVKMVDLLAMYNYDYTTDVMIHALDGYAKLMAPDMIRGIGIPVYTDVPPFPPSVLPSDIALNAVLVYAEKNAPNAMVDDPNPWVPLPSPPSGDAGPLRLWFAYDSRHTSGVGYVVDGEVCVRMVDALRITGGQVKQWSVTLKGPKKTAKITRTNFESCTAASCHRQTTVKYKGHSYSGLPLYLMVGKVDDNRDSNNWGDFNVKLAKKGYTVQFVNAKGKAVSVSSKLLAGKPTNIILAWRKDGKELTGSAGPLWLRGPVTKIKLSKQIGGLTRMNLRNVPK